jgi:isoaspartyl peptidase/L-asparaginase-like protein (Ntn-hydrolase superfamily)
MNLIIAVHIGAGQHNRRNIDDYRRCCSRACRSAMANVCSNYSTANNYGCTQAEYAALGATVRAIAVLEVPIA